MPRPRLASPLLTCTLGLTTALGTSACSRLESLFMSADTESTIPVHAQPNPRQAYRLTMTIENAPGPFGDVTGNTQYDVANRQACSKRDPVSGTVGRITHLPDLAWTPTGPGTYEAIVYADGLLDEDYYGLGVCHWELKGAAGILRATGDKRETRFMPAIDDDDIFAERTKILYFWKGGYPRSGMDDYPDLGETSIEKYGEALRNDLFSITLTARKVRP